MLSAHKKKFILLDFCFISIAMLCLQLTNLRKNQIELRLTLLEKNLYGGKPHKKAIFLQNDYVF